MELTLQVLNQLFHNEIHIPSLKLSLQFQKKELSKFLRSKIFIRLFNKGPERSQIDSKLPNECKFLGIISSNC